MNWNSPPQLKEILYNKLKLTCDVKTKGGKKSKPQPSTSDEALQQMRGQHPIIEKILEYRKYKKIQGTYIKNWLAWSEETGRATPDINSIGTPTGRISSNFQQIPNPGSMKYKDCPELAQQIRRGVIEDEGYSLVEADFSQCDLRVLADQSGDTAFINALNTGDTHQSVASDIYNVPTEKVTATQRSHAKAINLAIPYGKGDKALASEINVSDERAKEFIDSWFRKYPTVKVWMRQMVYEAKDKKYVQIPYGGKRRYDMIPDLFSNNKWERFAAERRVVNSICQGGTGYLLKHAKIKLFDLIPRNIMFEVHDALLFRVKDDELKSVCRIIKTGMENAYKMSVDLQVSIKVGKNLGEMEKV